MKKIEYTDSRIQQAIVLYKSGKAIKTICKSLALDDSVLRKFLIQENCLRKRSESIRLCKSKARIYDDALDWLLPDALYWIGFLYADGHIEKSPRQRISLTLSEMDKEHLVKYSKFFGTNIPIKDVTQENQKPAPGQINFEGRYLRVSFSSEIIYNRLKQLGFTNNKTMFITPHELLKNSRDFWRGVVDGDGSLYYPNDSRNNGKYNPLILECSGTQQTLLSLLDFFKNNNIVTEAIPHKDKRKNVWKLSINDVSMKAIKLLYKDASVYLDRKYNKYKENESFAIK